MAQRLATPGVYIEEKNAFPSSVAEVPTAVPAFVGYTEKVVKNGQSLLNKPVRIGSLAEYHATFGAGIQTTFHVAEATGTNGDFEAAGKNYEVVEDSASRFILYDSMRLFFANGGTTCYVVSVGGYYNEVTDTKSAPKTDKGVAPKTETVVSTKLNVISKKNLEAGIHAYIGELEPTIIVVPEAVMLEEGDCYAVQQAMLMHCGGKMKNRFTILDVYNGHLARTYDKSDVVTRFREGIGTNYLAFGAAYYPYIYTSIVENEDVDYNNISNLDVLESVLGKHADGGDPKKAAEIKEELKKLRQDNANTEVLTQTLNTVCPPFKVMLGAIRRKLNVMPPSGAIAGLYCMVDRDRGVWKAPANVSVASANSPVVRINHEDQEDLNVTISGKSINAIRSFIGEGTLVWGARTMDGNSQDWRYINVRRTMCFIEESIKHAAKTYVYEPNVSNTWILVRSMIASFLRDIWRRGALAGASEADAFDVQVGLGSTMTPNDILDGIMRVTVKVAITRPAEFIVITFQQKMQES